MDSTHIIPMLEDRIVEGLTQYCIADIPPRDPSRVTAVKAGRFQESPNESNLRLSVQGGDLDNPDLMDSIFDPEVHKNMMAFAIAAREIGGTQMWVRRGVVRLELFLIVEQKDFHHSRDVAYTILGRVQGNIEKIVVSDLYDNYGEHGVKLFSTQNSFFQSGGPPASYLYRGKVRWECLTER